MSNKKLLTTSIEELKEKITRFYFSVGGFFSGYDSIEIVKVDTQIKYILSHSLSEETKENIFSNEKWNEFLGKIFNENILYWENIYHNNNILDGTQWEFEIEFKDLPKLESGGSNEYPSNWKNILTIINEYFPQMELNDYSDFDEEDEEEA